MLASHATGPEFIRVLHQSSSFFVNLAPTIEHRMMKSAQHPGRHHNRRYMSLKKARMWPQPKTAWQWRFIVASMSRTNRGSRLRRFSDRNQPMISESTARC
jgi:hypothetical protein